MIAAALVARFAAALRPLWPGSGALGLAVSGGTDSLAMLLLAEAAIPGRFEVATVDHGLRAESAGECAMVARICAERGIPCAVLRPVVASGNLQASARRARYVALGEWAEERGLTALATAHHADDQAETLLMRLNRGSGVAGLAAVRESTALPSSRNMLIRPLLGFRRSDLEDVVAAHGLVAVNDPSNSDVRFDRARLRKAIADADWLDPTAFARSAARLADADTALTYFAERAWEKRVGVSDDAVAFEPPALRELAFRLTARAIAHFGGDPRGGDVGRLIERLEAGEQGNVAGVLATVEGAEWMFRREPARRAG